MRAASFQRKEGSLLTVCLKMMVNRSELIQDIGCQLEDPKHPFNALQIRADLREHQDLDMYLQRHVLVQQNH